MWKYLRNIWEMYIRSLSTTPLQIFSKVILNFHVIVKSIKDSDNNFLSIYNRIYADQWNKKCKFKNLSQQGVWNSFNNQISQKHILWHSNIGQEVLNMSISCSNYYKFRFVSEQYPYQNVNIAFLVVIWICIPFPKDLLCTNCFQLLC